VASQGKRRRRKKAGMSILTSIPRGFAGKCKKWPCADHWRAAEETQNTMPTARLYSVCLVLRPRGVCMDNKQSTGPKEQAKGFSHGRRPTDGNPRMGRVDLEIRYRGTSGGLPSCDVAFTSLSGRCAVHPNWWVGAMSTSTPDPRVSCHWSDMP
jgi:hypothetical protein